MEPYNGVPITSFTIEVQRDYQMKTIAECIAPEMIQNRRDKEKEIAQEESKVVSHIQNHIESFIGEFGTHAKGDWVNSADEEVAHITKKLKEIID